MAYHPTGMQEEDPILVGDAAFVHFCPDGKQLGLYGVITKDTQHLKQWSWEFDGECIGHTKHNHNHITFHYRIPGQDAVSVARDIWLDNGQQLRETFTLANRGEQSVNSRFSAKLETNFDSIFQIREESNSEAPYERAVTVHGDRFEYQRVDNQKLVSTSAQVHVDPHHVQVQTQSSNRSIQRQFDITLAPGESTSFGHMLTLDHGHKVAHDCPLPTLTEWRKEFGIPDFGKKPVPEAWRPLAQAADDLHAMMIRTEHGITLAAGVPRFLNQFGRDQLLTALKIIPTDASQKWRGEVVKGILRFLAANQGKEERTYSTQAPDGNPHPDCPSFVVETPGDIPHEIRYDEQSGLGLKDQNHPLGKRPFGRYYGTADTAPLFAAVVSEYCEKTGDKAFAQDMLPHVQGVLDWMEDPKRAVIDEHGFILYESVPRYIPGGPLTNKVWKDSDDSTVRADGRQFLEDESGEQRKANIGFIEVQGYAYRAYRGAAHTYRELGDDAKAATYDAKADRLQANVLEHFLTKDCDGNPVYAMAIGYHGGSGEMEKMNVHSSNPAHAMWTGVFGDKKNIQPILDSLQSPDHLWSGWGYRTLGKNELAYETRPGYAYHNGPVWPHEPINKGLQLYQETQELDRSTRAIYELAQIMPSGSIPELITGNERKILKHTGQSLPPEELGTASRIQTWSAAALLEAAELRKQEHLPDLTQAQRHRDAASR